MLTKWNFLKNNAIAGVSRPGPYYIYNYSANTHPLFYKINYLRFHKITFSMILIIYISWTYLKPQQYFISMMTDINMDDFPTRHYITLGHSVRLFNLFPS